MIILGIDPGFAILGYGVVKYSSSKFRVIDYKDINTSSKLEIQNRLLKLGDELEQIIIEYKPDVVAIENLFFNKNIKTALTVALARGVVMYLAAKHQIPIAEYTPLQVKQSVVGYGRADKIQVQQMVKVILNLSSMPKPDDVADALAVAVCHAHSANVHTKMRGN